MAARVFFSVSMSLDGFIAPEERGDDPDGQRWMAQWMELQQWIFPQRFFRENLKLGEGGEEGRDNDIARETFERTGASVMGKRMFDLGERMWPEEAPFHTPVFVVTHEQRDPWAAAGRDRRSTSSTTASRPRSTRPATAAGDRDVRIAGGGDDDPGVRERGPDRRVLDRALTRAVRLRNPPVRRRGRGPRRPGASPRRADAAGDPPDVRGPGAVTVRTSAAPPAGSARPPGSGLCRVLASGAGVRSGAGCHAAVLLLASAGALHCHPTANCGEPARGADRDQPAG